MSADDPTTVLQAWRQRFQQLTANKMLSATVALAVVLLIVGIGALIVHGQAEQSSREAHKAWERGDFAACVQESNRAITARRMLILPSKELAANYNQAAMALLQTGKVNQADSYSQEAVSLCKSLGQERSLMMSDVLTVRGYIQMQGDPNAAIRSFKQALRIRYAAVRGTPSPIQRINCAWNLDGLSKAYAATGNVMQADRYAFDAKSVRSSVIKDPADLRPRAQPSPKTGG